VYKHCSVPGENPCPQPYLANLSGNLTHDPWSRRIQDVRCPLDVIKPAAMEEVHIRPATADDAAAIARIYNHYILNTTVSFEEVAVSSFDITSRIEQVTANGFPWLVIEQAGRLAGYAYANKWGVRSAYRFSVEASVYLDHTQTGQGLGTRLYETLFSLLKERSVHVVIGGITLPNPASIALHEKFGMQKAAHYKEVGFKFGQWLDVGYWQVVL
jgi:L-amino acid N-acyltransferase YncA